MSFLTSLPSFNQTPLDINIYYKNNSSNLIQPNHSVHEIGEDGDAYQTRNCQGLGSGQIHAIFEPEPDKGLGFRLDFESEPLLSYRIRIGFGF